MPFGNSEKKGIFLSSMTVENMVQYMENVERRDSEIRKEQETSIFLPFSIRLRAQKVVKGPRSGVVTDIIFQLKFEKIEAGILICMIDTFFLKVTLL
jgi:hypothetical protein